VTETRKILEASWRVIMEEGILTFARCSLEKLYRREFRIFDSMPQELRSRDLKIFQELHSRNLKLLDFGMGWGRILVHVVGFFWGGWV